MGGSESLIVLNDQGGDSMNIEKDCISPTLRAEAHNNELIVFHTMQDPITSETVTPCLSSGSPNGQAVVGVNVDYAVRRLTPLECERLQGYPDGWTDIGEWTDTNGKTHAESTDSARYKAIGNSIALPPWAYVLQRLSICCGDDITMASLFDGLGGFPLIWERLNGAGTCLWASEIEEFPIAVTKRHFNEKGTRKEQKMAEYIKRSELQAAMKSVTDDTTCPLHLAAEIDQIIDLAPAADVQEVRHGVYDWVSEDSNIAECSCCSFQVEHPLFNDFNYCPYCGAKLDGERSGANV